MDQEKIINFLEYYLEAGIDGTGEEEAIEEISKELEAAGIDAESSERSTLEMIASAKIEAKKERGKKFKEEFYRLLGEVKSNHLQIENEMPELAVAFRKMEGSTDMQDMLDDEDKMKLLEYLRKKKNL